MAIFFLQKGHLSTPPVAPALINNCNNTSVKLAKITKPKSRGNGIRGLFSCDIYLIKTYVVFRTELAKISVIF